MKANAHVSYSRSLQTVDRRSAPDLAEFRRVYVRARRPVILQGALDHWPALGKWTPQFFRERYGDEEVAVAEGQLRMRELIDRVLASSATRPAPYLHNVPIFKYMPELIRDVSPFPIYTRPNWLESRLFPDDDVAKHNAELYIGGGGGKFPVLHYDNCHAHAFICQLHGEKEFTLFGPDQTQLLYADDPIMPNLSGVDDIESPDLVRFPLFVKAVPTKLFLGPGEMLFIPAGWWHTARMLNPSVSVSFNSVDATNWGDFVHDSTRMAIRSGGLRRGLMSGGYLTAMGWIERLRSAWPRAVDSSPSVAMSPDSAPRRPIKGSADMAALRRRLAGSGDARSSAPTGAR